MDLGIQRTHRARHRREHGHRQGHRHRAGARGRRLAVVARRRNLLEELEKELGAKLVIIEQDFLQPRRAGEHRRGSARRPGLGRHPDQQRRRQPQLHARVERGAVGRGAHAQLHAPAPARAPPAAADDGAQVGPHRQHHRQVRARGPERRLRRQGGDAFLGEGPVARGRQARHHGELRFRRGASSASRSCATTRPSTASEQSEQDIPVGEYGQPADIANLVCFLASPLARYITGAVIPVDGGLRRYQF